jgi:hypothetical protein
VQRDDFQKLSRRIKQDFNPYLGAQPSLLLGAMITKKVFRLMRSVAGRFGV